MPHGRTGAPETVKGPIRRAEPMHSALLSDRSRDEAISMDVLLAIPVMGACAVGGLMYLRVVASGLERVEIELAALEQLADQKVKKGKRSSPLDHPIITAQAI